MLAGFVAGGWDFYTASLGSHLKNTMSKICDDCGAVEGSLHEAFCTRERCPFCDGQLVSCGCVSKVLKLDADEQKSLDEYEDDSAEPLAGIIRRWVDALDRKGRVPF